MPALLSFVLLAFSMAAMGQVAHLSADAKASISPALETWRKLNSEPKCFGVETDSTYCSELRNQLDSQLLALAHRKDASADEGVAALFSFGLHKSEGDQGHDLICIASARGNAMTRALKKYRSCELDISSEYPESMRSEIAACQTAIDRAIGIIRKHSADKICAWD